MNQLQSILLPAAEQGLLFGILAIGLVVSFRIVRFPDLTVEGSFALGAAIAAATIAHSVRPGFATLIALLIGASAGLTTGLIWRNLRLAPILSGIIVMTMLYSINLRIMQQRPNIPLFDKVTLSSSLQRTSHPHIYTLSFLLVLVTASIYALWLLSRTEIGLYLRASGLHGTLVKSLGRDPTLFVVLGLMIANSFVALCGALSAQDYGYADVNMGFGTLVAGLAALSIGRLIASSNGVLSVLIAGCLGSICYELIRTVLLRVGLYPSDLKLATGILLILIAYSAHVQRRSDTPQDQGFSF